MRTPTAAIRDEQWDLGGTLTITDNERALIRLWASAYCDGHTGTSPEWRFICAVYNVHPTRTWEAYCRRYAAKVPA